MTRPIRIVEVGLRDGLQNVSAFLPTGDKLRIARALIDSGVRCIEATSFVRPQWIPQMADADAVAREVRAYAQGKQVEVIALAPNARGVERAREAGMDTAVCVVSASETHNRKNVNRTIPASLAEFEEACKRKGPMRIKLSIATAFGCPYEKEIPAEKVLDLARKGLQAGADELLLCDTIGVADPYQVRDLVRRLRRDRDLAACPVGLHLHDTRGMSLACTVSALEEGVSTFEAAVGGLGGCPFAPGASGNQATEDLAAMLSRMGFDTGIDLEKLLEATALVEQLVPVPVTSHLHRVRACVSAFAHEE